MKLWQKNSNGDAAKQGATAPQRHSGAAPQGERGTAIAAKGLPAGDLQLAQLPHPATLVMPTGERMPGKIMRCTGTELQVLMLYEMQRPLGEAQLNQIVLEIDDGHNKTRLGGSTLREDRETLRFSKLQVVQRREHVRVSASLLVEVTLPGCSEPLECRSIDLSGGGMLVRGIEHLQLGDRLAFAITLDERVPEISGDGTIVRCDPGGPRAICFDSITDSNQQRLIRFLFERQREARRKGLLI